KLAEFVAPSGRVNYASNAFGKIDGAQPEEIGRYGIRRFRDAKAQVSGVDLKFFRDFVELHFLSEARLHRAMASFRSTWRLIGECSAALKFVPRNMVSSG